MIDSTEVPGVCCITDGTCGVIGLIRSRFTVVRKTLRGLNPYLPIILPVGVSTSQFLLWIRGLTLFDNYLLKISSLSLS